MYEDLVECEKFVVQYDGNETLKDGAENFLGIYKYVGNKSETNRPVFVLSNSTFNSLILNSASLGWLGMVDITHLLIF